MTFRRLLGEMRALRPEWQVKTQRPGYPWRKFRVKSGERIRRVIITDTLIGRLKSSHAIIEAIEHQM